MEHFPFFKWLFTNPSSYFLKTFSSLSHVRLFSACVWGSMGAEKGNYTASDLGMTVGFGLGLRVGSRMTETREVSLVYECSVYCNRPPNGDQTLQSRSEPRHLPPVPPLSLPGSRSPTPIITVRPNRCTFLRGQKLCVRWDGEGSDFLFVWTHLLCDRALKGDYIITIVASEPSAFLRRVV